MNKLPIDAKIYHLNNERPRETLVEALNDDGDGEFYTAVFSGANHFNRAIEYAEYKFESYTVMNNQQ